MYTLSICIGIETISLQRALARLKEEVCLVKWLECRVVPQPTPSLYITICNIHPILSVFIRHYRITHLTGILTIFLGYAFSSSS